MMKLAPEVEFIERGWLSANMVILGGDERGPVVVDTGYVSHATQTLALVQQHLQREGHRSPRALLNTHLHSDHCGGNSVLQAHHACPVWIPSGEFDAALAWKEDALSFGDTGQRCERFVPGRALQPGEVVSQGPCHWEVHAAPGHDPASVILFEARLGLLISADALWEHGFGIVFPEIGASPASGLAFTEVEATLDLIQALQPAAVLPGHGPAFHDITSALHEARSRLAFFRAEPVRHALHAGKALLMYHLMEWRERSHEELLAWLDTTPVQGRLRAQAQMPVVEEWAHFLIQGLSRAGLIKQDEYGVQLLSR